MVAPGYDEFVTPHSNPLVRAVVGELYLNEDQLAMIERAVDDLIRERATGTGTAVLIGPINIGIGTT